MMPRLAVVFAEGFEEIEAITIVDVLRRAQIDVDTVGVSSLSVKGSHDIEAKVDKLLKEVDPKFYDGVVLPGGLPGSFTLRDNEDVQNFIRAFDGKLQAAVCAAPIALQKAGVLEAIHVTSHPSMKEEFSKQYYLETPAVIDGKVVTSRGAGTSFEFVAAILTVLELEEKIEDLRAAMLYPNFGF